MRSRLALLLAAGLAAASLAGCGAQAQPEPEGTTAAVDCTPSGKASDSIEVSEELGVKPTVSFDTPLDFTETERTVVVEGDGEQSGSGAAMVVELTMFNAETGDELVSTGHDGTQATQVVLEDGLLPGFEKTLNCLTVGSRVVAAITSDDAYGETGFPEQNIEPNTPLVLVADFVSIPEPPLARADGEPQERPAGFPDVEVQLGEDGAPAVTVPEEEPPAELQIAVLKKGEGDPVADGDNVTVHYVGVDWETGEVFDQSWPNGTPATFNTGQVVPGFSAALIGQTVGSQVLAVLPPDQAYGPEETEQAPLGGKTLVFVIDILATS